MEDREEFGRVLKFWQKKLKLNQAQLAEKIGASQNHISSLGSGKRLPSWELVLNLAGLCGVTVRELLTIPLMDPESYYAVPMVAAVPRAGNGGLQTDGDFTGWYIFRTDYLSKKGTPSEMLLFQIEGDSMEPNLKPNDVVMIDQSQTRPLSGKIYLIGMGGELMVKRIFPKPSSVTIYSDNKEFYPPFEISGSELEELIIYGKMVWSGRDYA